jgi:chromosome segregation ATPase
MVGFLVGIIILVFAGIFFSLLADKRFSFSSNRISLESTIRDEKSELDSLKSRLETTREHWRKHCEPLRSQDVSASEIAAALRASQTRLKGLREELAVASSEVASVTDDFEEYRSRYRQQVRGAAAEERLGELKSRTGRTYTNVVIRKVSSAGIEIRHDQGISRLLPEELDPAWHERFQWTRDEVTKTLEEEKARQDRHNRFVDDKTAAPVAASKKPRKSRIPGSMVCARKSARPAVAT